jgi:hypothetical protein
MPYDAKTETPIDWVWGVGFEGRSARPIGRTAPGSGGGGGGGGGAPAGIPPVAQFTLAGGGGSFKPGEDVQVVVGIDAAAGSGTDLGIAFGFSYDLDGVVMNNVVEFVGVAGSAVTSTLAMDIVTLTAPAGGNPTYTIKVTATDDNGNIGKAFQTINVDPPIPWTSHAFTSAVDTLGLLNAFTIRLQPSGDIPAGDTIKITGLTGMNHADGNLVFTESDDLFGSVTWDSATSTVTLTPDMDVPAASVTTVYFEITNGIFSQAAITPTLSALGMESVTLDPAGTIVSPLTNSSSGLANAIAQGMVTTTTNAALLLLTPPAQVAGQIDLYYTEADMRFHFYDYNANVWRHFQFQT